MSEDKKNPATDKRRDKEFDKGRRPRSRDLKAVAMITGVTASLWLFSTAAVTQLTGATRHIFGHLDGLDGQLPGLVGKTLAMTAAPAVMTAFILSFAVCYWEVGGLHFKGLKFDLEGMNPFTGIQRVMISPQAFKRLGIEAAKVLAAGWVCYVTLKQFVPELLTAQYSSLGVVLKRGAELLGTLSLRVILVMLVIGILDWMYNKWTFEKNIRMDDSEVKDERKAADGDPEVKKRQRRRGIELLQQRIGKTVPKADVVLVNPTHYAVAIQYAQGRMGAPRVVAKGMDGTAARIRAIARKHTIPVVPQPALTRELYRRVRVGREIPVDLYQAVATVLAYVYRLRRRAA